MPAMLHHSGACCRKFDLCDVPGHHAHLEFKPIRVSSMNICSVVVFCGFIEMTKDYSSAFPHVCSGATSWSAAKVTLHLSGSNISRRAS